MRTEQLECDFCVVGGGMAGVCAAIAAARDGARTVLVHDRPVLGGNASSEIRVWIQGATASGGNAFAREGGVLNEILLENLYRNPEANPHLFDAVLLDFVTREPNLTLLLNTAAFECAMQTRPEDGPARSLTRPEDGPARSGDVRIASVSAFNSHNQTRHNIAAAIFADCSGDGILGFLAGAEFHFGREPRSQYNEPWAPEQGDRNTLGDSMYFYTKRHPHPVMFVKPSFALDITTAGIPQVRIDRIGRTAEPFGCELWWLEYGGLLDAIYDAEKIKHHLTCLIYGVWDYIKNSGKIANTENLTLEWVGGLPGKREGRRFIGDHVLTQQDVIEQRQFPDAIGAAGWSIDLHPSGGIYCADAPSMHDHADWVYNVPFRCLYSRNVANLLLAGRCISASHVGFGSIRVMGTGAMCGQAIGTAAAQCVGENVTPRQIAGDPQRVTRLQQRLLRDGQHIVGLTNADPADLARSAKVAASSVAVLDRRESDELGVRLVKGAQWMLPLTDAATEWVELLVHADDATELAYTVKVNDRVINYEPNVVVAEHKLPLRPGRQWVRVPLCSPSTCVGEGRREGDADARAFGPAAKQIPHNVWLRFAANDKVELRCQRCRTTGTLLNNYTFRAGFYQHSRHTPCFRLDRPQPGLYDQANVIDGHHRPFVLPHAWVSLPLADGPQWIELTLPAPAKVGEIQITFNGDVNQLIWTQLFPADIRTTAEIVKDLDVELIDPAGQPARVFQIRGNHQAMVRLSGDGEEASRIRITCLATWGHDRAEIFEVRVYAAE